MPQIQGVKGEAVVVYCEPLTTPEMRYHRLSQRVNNMAGFSLFLDVTRSKFHNIAQIGRKVRLLLLFRAFCHAVYATLGLSSMSIITAFEENFLLTHGACDTLFESNPLLDLSRGVFL